MSNKSDKYKHLKQIKDEVVALKQSPLYQYRVKNKYKPVIGHGDHNAKIMFIGEAPGKNEAETGVPFCGAAGRVLNELLETINLTREQVYVTNIVKDRPPNNRDPTTEEIKLYSPFLIKQIQIISPGILATLGRFSMEFIMKEFGLKEELNKISLLHGQTFVTKHSPKSSKYQTKKPVQIVPLYHPAVALYNASKKPILEKDFQILETMASLI